MNTKGGIWNWKHSRVLHTVVQSAHRPKKSQKVSTRLLCTFRSFHSRGNNDRFFLRLNAPYLDKSGSTGNLRRRWQYTPVRENPSRMLIWKPTAFLSHIVCRTHDDRFPIPLCSAPVCSTSDPGRTSSTMLMPTFSFRWIRWSSSKLSDSIHGTVHIFGRQSFLLIPFRHSFVWPRLSLFSAERRRMEMSR